MLALKTEAPGPRNSFRLVLGNVGDALVGLPATVADGSVGLTNEDGSNCHLPRFVSRVRTAANSRFAKPETPVIWGRFMVDRAQCPRRECDLAIASMTH